MKRLFLVLVFLASILLGGWLLLANKFEQMVNDDILPKLTKHPEIVYADPSAIQIDKYKFNVKLGSIELLPDNEEFSANIHNVDIYYNPLKNKISACFGNGNHSFTIKDKGFYTQNISGHFAFTRELLKGEKSDFDIGFKFADSALHEAATDTKLADIGGGGINFTYNKKDGFVNPELKIDFKDLDASEEAQKRIDQLYAQINNGIYQDELAKLFHQDISEIPKTISINNKTQYSLLLNASITEKIADSFAAFTINPNLEFLAILLDSEKFAFKIVNKADDGIFVVANNLDLKKNGSYFEFDSHFNVNENLSDQQREEVAKALAKAYAKYFLVKYKTDIISEAYLNFARKVAAIDNMNVNLHFGYDIEKTELTHKIQIGSKFDNINYNLISSGDFTNNKYVGNIQINGLGKFIDGVAGTVSDKSDILAQKLKNTDNKDVNFSQIQKVAQHIKENGFDTIKVFHKAGAENLTPEGNFEADLNIDTSFENFSVEINGTKAMEFLVDPVISKFLNDWPKTNKEQQTDK